MRKLRKADLLAEIQTQNFLNKGNGDIYRQAYHTTPRRYIF
jgi:hypothetical protein